MLAALIQALATIGKSHAWVVSGRFSDGLAVVLHFLQIKFELFVLFCYSGEKIYKFEKNIYKLRKKGKKNKKRNP